MAEPNKKVAEKVNINKTKTHIFIRRKVSEVFGVHPKIKLIELKNSETENKQVKEIIILKAQTSYTYIHTENKKKSTTTTKINRHFLQMAAK